MNDRVYTHPQETWDEKECLRRARSAPANHWGDRPPKGLINAVGSPYVGYGRTVSYNGGCIRDGEWYQSEAIPLPSIPDSYEFVTLRSWGLRIQKKQIQHTHE
jgi:hypothetical protein